MIVVRPVFDELPSGCSSAENLFVLPTIWSLLYSCVSVERIPTDAIISTYQCAVSRAVVAPQQILRGDERVNI